MANFIQSLLKFKSVNPDKLLAFGFIKTDTGYFYSTTLPQSEFIMNVTADANGNLTAQIIDSEFDEPYTLHLVDGAAGEFVGQVRTDYERVLTEIADNCYETEIFKTDYLKTIIRHVRETYGDELEYLWKKCPDNAIWRRKDNQKWYGALLTTSAKKFGIDSGGDVTVIDLRIEPTELDVLVDNKRYFRGYHMNKQHWFTMIMDGSMDLDEVFRRIQNSYELAK